MITSSHCPLTVLHGSVGDKQVPVSLFHQESLHYVAKNVRNTGIHLIKCRHPQHRASHLGCLAHGVKESLLKQLNKDKIGQVTTIKVPIFLLVFAGTPRVTSCDGSSHTEDNKGKRILITLLFEIIWDDSLFSPIPSNTYDSPELSLKSGLGKDLYLKSRHFFCGNILRKGYGKKMWKSSPLFIPLYWILNSPEREGEATVDSNWNNSRY